jgi:predicted NAD/FAD-binding protein
MHKNIPFFITSLLAIFSSAIGSADQPKVAIIGSGGAGLTSAWLLENDYDVTVFEKEDRLGGHCYTIDVEHDGVISQIDTGAEFFSDSLFPHFMKLLNTLQVPINKFVLTNTFFNTDGSETIFLPPINEGKVAWESFFPSNLFDLIQFKHVLSEGQRILDIKDTGLTIKQFVDNLETTENFKNHFLYPFMAAGWGVSSTDIQSFAAYDVLKYFVSNQPQGLNPIYWNEIVGGTITYINTLANQLTNTTINLSTNITNIAYNNNVYTITLDDGIEQQFDYLVMATNSSAAADLLQNIPEKTDICTILKQIKYYNTTIAIHGDSRFLPQNQADWAVANIAYDGTNSAMTIYKPWLDGPSPIFRSWLTYTLQYNNADLIPNSLYATVEWQHPIIDIDYFHAQRAIQFTNGNQNLWFAGIYTYDNDSHESVIISAMNIAHVLAPNSERLAQITQLP